MVGVMFILALPDEHFPTGIRFLPQESVSCPDTCRFSRVERSGLTAETCASNCSTG